MTLPIDNDARHRFVTGLSRNFSVVASAGSGKTRAVTDRIISIATSPHALEWLPSLVVVTFTNRAADEMQQRARQRILEEGVSLEVLAAFNRAFFGTIHAFCVKLLRQQAHHLGLPSKLDVLTDDSALWMEFVQRQGTVGADLTDAQRRCLRRLAPVRELMELGRGGHARGPFSDPGPFPAFDFDPVFSYVAKGASKKTIPPLQDRLRTWEHGWVNGEGYLPPPDCTSKAAEFVPLWDAAFGPIREWLRSCSARVAGKIGADYRAFRLSKGAINYDDQIALGCELLRHPEAARRVRERNYRVILDEAQDTDAGQFEVLLELTRPTTATGSWLGGENAPAPPRPGHFCMVGDFQQSIFGDRADLANYRRVHDALVSAAEGERVEFSVTFRLDEGQIRFVNETFSKVLTGANGQVHYVKLNSRPNVLPGQVVRFELGELPDLSGWRESQKARLEANRLATWLANQGLQRLRARSWREVAVICPRKSWFPPLRVALRANGFEVQIQSERDLKGDSPAYAWFTALAVIMASPREGYEIVGVLREVFGLSDHNLAKFAEGRGERWQIIEATQRKGPVAETINLLAELRSRISTAPLFCAMRDIVETVRLRERLLALPLDEAEGIDAEIDALLTLAAAAEADGATLGGFAEGLRGDFSATREVRTTELDAIQLITSHKAKGSEWDAVVIPYFARGVSQRSAGYPRMIRDPQSGTMRAALAAADLNETLKEAIAATTRQELDRLLYVANTRARHTLVLAHDHALYAGKSGLPRFAPARLLELGDEETFATLPNAPTECAATESQNRVRAERHVTEQAVARLADFSGDLTSTARERATHFIKRNPSALAEAALTEQTLEHPARARRSELPNEGALYGTWWHEFVEGIDWRAGVAAWEETFAKALGCSPNAEQSKREWAMLRDELAGNGDFARRLTQPGAVSHAELPFLWAMNERECIEGIIDLAIFEPSEGNWVILDWKTNRPQPDGAEELRTHYLPQLSAYWRVVSEMFGVRVDAGLYSTALGRWLPYEPGELEASWNALAGVPEALAEALKER